MSMSLMGLDETARTIQGGTLDALRARLRGALVSEGEAGYDEARTLWNAMVDRRPGLVIRALDVDDIRHAVDFAAANDLLIAVRGGGHQIAGHAVAEGAVLLDLSLMRAVEVDPAARTARVEPGATLGEVDAATQQHALALPVGINSTTGIAGLTLGGGFGWITRRYGLTIDSLVSAEIVSARGEVLRASADENPDLFWALRGGGGNFGVVASFEFGLHPLGPEVFAGLIVHPLDDAPEIMRQLQDIAAAAPDALTVWSVFRRAPPLPFLPEAWHGREVMILAACYAGDPGEGEAATAGLRALGAPVAVAMGRQPFTAWQGAFDPLLTEGARNYWKSHDFMSLPGEAVDTLMDAVRNVPSPECEIFIAHLGGAMARVAPDATAYPQRASHFLMNVHTRWRDAADDAACIGWARDLFDSMTPHAAGSVYVNFMPEDDDGRVGAAYGGNLERLAAVKAAYDPSNLFRLNHNIRPA